MLHRYFLAVTVWVIGGVLLTGCASSPPPSADSAAGNAARTKAADAKLVEAHAHYAQGVIYDLDEEPELALEEFSKAALGDPANEELVLELSRRYLQRKQLEQALTLLTRATALPEASGALFARLGFIYSRLGKDEQAIEASQTAIKRAPQSLVGYQNLFVIHLQKGRPAEALKALDRAAKQLDTDAAFLVNLAELYANLERQAPSQKQFADPGATAVLDRALKLDPPDPRLRLKLADGFNLMGDSTNAAQIYLQLLNRYSEQPAIRDDVRAKLADIYMRGRDLKKAGEQLEAIIRDDPANAQAYYFLGSMAYDDKNLPKAADYFHKTLLLTDDIEQAFYDLAAVQINLDQPKEALAT